MNKIDITEFIFAIKEELDNFEHYQTTYSTTKLKTMAEWVDKFVKFSGYEDSLEDEYEESEEEIYYGEDLQFEDLVNRRKYSSFRDDDRY